MSYSSNGRTPPFQGENRGSIPLYDANLNAFEATVDGQLPLKENIRMGSTPKLGSNFYDK